MVALFWVAVLKASWPSPASAWRPAHQVQLVDQFTSHAYTLARRQLPLPSARNTGSPLTRAAGRRLACQNDGGRQARAGNASRPSAEGGVIDDEKRRAVCDAVRDAIDREIARLEDPGAAIPGVDPDDGHGWHPWTPDRVAHPREPGVPLFHAECWRYFRLLELGWLDDTLLIGFAWDELGTPDLHYLTRVRFTPSLLERGPRVLALTARGHLRWLLAPTDTAVRVAHAHTRAIDPGRHWRERCGRLWLDQRHVLVEPGPAPDQDDLDRHWTLPWPSLTNPATRP